MKKLALAGALISANLLGCTIPERSTRPADTPSRASAPDQAWKDVAPGLARYTSDYVDTALWQRPGLSPRDRSLITLAALIARNQLLPLEEQLDRALGNGVQAAEISELITHLAFYAGWGNAVGAATRAHDVFQRHGVTARTLPAAQGPLLPLNEEEEAARAARVAGAFGEVAPGVVENTTALLFRDLWLRPGLAPHDRSLITVSALVAAGQTAQVPVHLNKAMDAGLTQEQASESLTHLAFYAGWPNVFSALPVFKDVYAKRTR